MKYIVGYVTTIYIRLQTVKQSFLARHDWAAGLDIYVWSLSVWSWRSDEWLKLELIECEIIWKFDTNVPFKVKMAIRHGHFYFSYG